ncbi:insulinase family protein [Aidingimonas halophila]|uniref:Insulinase (Peptidase family M16) n=1 Tax=Aidingimonas halophila TaxID=574349 RepID=A0A1H2Z715_9GAMM|nr:insulinase family protein [Aidingimonas halophila]GHC15484.1 hypothetical protein GCM10008094_00540 [Aidingimonas halophila]SDX13283.1 Insulinase (Peptidase family M16) [Aidingimonas halophila]
MQQADVTFGLPPGMRHQEQRLDNGLRLLAIQVPEARWARLVGTVGAGYLDEPDTWPGLAHLLEHLLFLESAPERYDTAWVTTQGGRYNAHTDETVTDIHLRLPSAAAETGAEWLADRLLHPALDKESILHEVGILDAEFRARLADPLLHRQAALTRFFHHRHPASQLRHGHHVSLGGDTSALQQALRGFYTDHYRAERIELTMLGPQPLDDMLGWLEHAGTRFTPGAQPHVDRPSRWREEGARHLQWCLPAEQGAVDGIRLELLWPLPMRLSVRQTEQLDRLIAWLNDGQLATSLGPDISHLEASRFPTGTGPALSLSVDTHQAVTEKLSLIATCQSAVSDLAARLPDNDHRHSIASPPRPEQDLDSRVLMHARRRAMQARLASEPTTPAVLSDWLAATYRRVLERQPSLSSVSSYVPETHTPIRPHEIDCDLPQLMSLRAAPRLAYRPAHRKTSLRRLPLEGIHFWQGGSELPPACCLGWPAEPTQRRSRLMHWRQKTLALRQVASARGMALSLASDRYGDYLIAQGDPSRLTSLAMQVIAAWPRGDMPSMSSHDASQGLIAQRLLNRLDQPLATLSTMPTACGWMTHAVSPECLQRLIDTIPVTRSSATDTHGPITHVAPWPERFLSCQGHDNVLMLQVDGPDDTPATRLLMQLLASCHDGAFHHEVRTRRELGYAAAVRYREGGGWPRLGYVIQSPHADIATLQGMVETFLVDPGQALATLDDATFRHRRQHLLAHVGAPETAWEGIARRWQALRTQPDHGPHPAWETDRGVLDQLESGDLITLATQLADGRLPGCWWLHESERASRE